MDIDAKLRPLYLTQILKERTDEDHYLTTPQLCAILKDEYGMETHRTTIKSDIEMLQQAGIGIQAVRSSQNQYNFIDREFDIAELKLLIDAVESSKFITKSKSEQLVAKLTSFAGAFKGRELKRNLAVDGRIKPENEQIFYIVDVINEAINHRRKIRFQKTEYNIRKEVVLHNNGEKYTFSPYSLIWDGDFYYVVGYSDKYKSIGSHRVDRIAKQPEILDETYQKNIEEIQANLSMLRLLLPVLIVVCGGIGFFASFLATRGRTKEFAVMRCLAIMEQMPSIVESSTPMTTLSTNLGVKAPEATCHQRASH